MLALCSITVGIGKLFAHIRYTLAVNSDDSFNIRKFITILFPVKAQRLCKTVKGISGAVSGWSGPVKKYGPVDNSILVSTSDSYWFFLYQARLHWRVASISNLRPQSLCRLRRYSSAIYKDNLFRNLRSLFRQYRQPNIKHTIHKEIKWRQTRQN